MTDIIVRFFIGGLVVSVFSVRTSVAKATEGAVHNRLAFLEAKFSATPGGYTQGLDC